MRRSATALIACWHSSADTPRSTSVLRGGSDTVSDSKPGLPPNCAAPGATRFSYLPKTMSPDDNSVVTTRGRSM